MSFHSAVTAQPNGFEEMNGDEKKFMKKSIAENMIQSTHINGGFAPGPQFGTLRHKPGKTKSILWTLF